MSSYRLIVTEKPSVARDIGRVLGIHQRGDGFLRSGDTHITWCVGHLLQLAEPTSYNPDWKRWSLDSLPMIPGTFALQPRDTAQDQWAVVAKQLAGATEVVNACDAGREGELIFAWAYEAAACKAPVKRLWISSMTDAAIRDGFAKLRDGAHFAPLEAAARCRAEADWLVGLNATRAMTTRFSTSHGRVLLSVGRVQTPTLALLCRREDEIEAFVPEAFYQVKARLRAEEGEWDAVWTRPGIEKRSAAERIAERGEAEAIVARLKGANGALARVQRKKSREKPPQLYDLTTLQKECNRRFKYPAKRTLELAQSLYETHKVLTYPRTDARHLGADQVPGLPEKIRGLAFGPYEAAAQDILARWPVALDKRIVDDAEVSDHHAIIPTGTDPRRARLSPDEKRVFDLVARRTLAVMMPDAVFAVARMDAQFGDDVLTARGRTCLDAGWRVIDPPQTTKKEVLLPPVEKGAAVAVKRCRLVESATKPPRRFTEATLLAAMEGAGDALRDADMKRAMKRNGLGTAATRAAIIETLLARTYAARESGNIIATPHGRRLVSVLPAQGLTSAKLTGAWEARLVAMAEGKEQRQAFMADIAGYAAELVDAIRGATDAVVQDANFRPPPPTGEVLGACPRCQEEVRRGRFDWRCVACGLRVPGAVAKRTLSPTLAKALLKKGETKAVKGFRSRAGKEFAAALRFDEAYAVKFVFAEPDAIGDCPACKKPVRPRGPVFSCDTGRDCAFVMFAEMAGHTVTVADVEAVLRDGRTGFLRGLQGRNGPSFDGVLAWHQGRVRALEMDERLVAGAVGPCPKCKAPVRFASGAWRCSGCRFALPQAFLQRPLLAEDARALLDRGRTFRLHGFRRRGAEDSKPFKAALILEADGSLAVDYSPDAGERPVEAGGPPPAFGERVDCPRCVVTGELRPGYVIAGKRAWGCSRWRAGCELRVPFAIGGVALSPEQGRRLLGKNHATRYEAAFAEEGTARVVLCDEAPGYRIEPRGKGTAKAV